MNETCCGTCKWANWQFGSCYEPGLRMLQLKIELSPLPEVAVLDIDIIEADRGMHCKTYEAKP